MKQAVQILFPGFTIGDKIYDRGDIELVPTKYLVELAEKKVKQFHRDSNKKIRIARIVDADDLEKSREDMDFGDELDYDMKSTPKSTEPEIDDDLKEKKNKELRLMAIDLGCKDNYVKSIKGNKLRQLITFLRKL